MQSKCIFRYLCLFLLLNASCRNEKERADKVDTYQDYEQLFNDRINKLTVENIYESIENQNVYFWKDSLHRIDIKSLINRHKFFFYFTDQTCPPCIESTVDCIKAIFPEYEKDNEIIFISPDCVVRLRENRYGKKLLILTNGKLGVPLEKIHVPFIFTLDENLRVSNLHIVNKNDFNKTLQFLQSVRDK